MGRLSERGREVAKRLLRQRVFEALTIAKRDGLRITEVVVEARADVQEWSEQEQQVNEQE